MAWGTEDDSYEVFAQFGVGNDVTLVGSVRASDPELAWHAAKESYTRRERCTLLWVVPRTAIYMSDDGDRETLLSGVRMDFRGPAYPGRHRRAREEALAATADRGEDAR